MKNIILIIMSIISIESFAQYGPENYMSENWAMEDMSNPYGSPSYGNNMKGVYFWRPNNEWYFTTTMSRVSDQASSNGIGYVSYTSTHNAGSYHPVGVGFGSNTNGEEFSIDMSAPGNDKVFIEIENASNQDLNIRVGLKDINNHLIDTKAGTQLTNIPSGIIDMVVPKYSTKSATFYYKDGYYAEWGNVTKCTDWANPLNKTTPCAIKIFDFTKVVGANITINSTNPQNVGVTNAEIKIRKIEFGAKPITTEIKTNATSQAVVVYPNPSENVFFIKTENDIKWNLINVYGTLIDSDTTNCIDLSNQPAGIYLLYIDEKIVKLIKN